MVLPGKYSESCFSTLLVAIEFVLLVIITVLFSPSHSTVAPRGSAMKRAGP